MSEQEQFWAGQFGDEYTRRNLNLRAEADFIFFSNILTARTERARHIQSIIEYGAGSGSNLRALKRIIPNPGPITAVEINPEARKHLEKIEGVLIDSRPAVLAVYTRYDLVLTKGFLIHVPPHDLPFVYENLYKATGRFLLMCEYYCPRPREILYRGHHQRCWARDFAGEFLDMYGKDMRLIDYGFTYHLDQHPQDDLTWFLLEKFDPRMPEM